MVLKIAAKRRVQECDTKGFCFSKPLKILSVFVGDGETTGKTDRGLDSWLVPESPVAADPTQAPKPGAQPCVGGASPRSSVLTTAIQGVRSQEAGARSRELNPGNP